MLSVNKALSEFGEGMALGILQRVELCFPYLLRKSPFDHEFSQLIWSHCN